MIYPISLYNFGKVCQDSTMVGNVIRALCKQGEVSLTPAEQTILEMIRNDNTWMDERVEAKKERAAERQRRSREQRARAEDGAEQNPVVTHCHTQECDKCDNDECHTQRCDNTLVTPPTYLPSSLPTSLPTNKTNINRTDPDKGVEGEIGSASDRRIDVVGIPDEVLFSGRYDVLDLYNSAFGKGFWAKARRQLGDAMMLEELSAYLHEVRAGETVANPAAVMTQRLKAKGVK